MEPEYAISDHDRIQHIATSNCSPTILGMSNKPIDQSRRARYLRSRGRPLDYKPPRHRINGHASRALMHNEYAQLVTHQLGRCAICGDRSRLTVDHCHDTGLLRGLLCHPCNVGLRAILKDTARHPKAWAYVVSPPALNLFRIELPLDMKGRSVRFDLPKSVTTDNCVKHSVSPAQSPIIP